MIIVNIHQWVDLIDTDRAYHVSYMLDVLVCDRSVCCLVLSALIFDQPITYNTLLCEKWTRLCRLWNAGADRRLRVLFARTHTRIGEHWTHTRNYHIAVCNWNFLVCCWFLIDTVVVWQVLSAQLFPVFLSFNVILILFVFFFIWVLPCRSWCSIKLTNPFRFWVFWMPGSCVTRIHTRALSEKQESNTCNRLRREHHLEQQQKPIYYNFVSCQMDSVLC